MKYFFNTKDQNIWLTLMDVQLISPDQLEHLFLNIGDQSKAEELSQIIIKLNENPQFIQIILFLSNTTKYEKVLFQCSVICYNSIKFHWESLSQDIQQDILNQLFKLIGNTCSYFPYCIEYIGLKSPEFRPQIIGFVLSFLNSPDIKNSMNSYQFLSIFEIIIFFYPHELYEYQNNFLLILIHILSNPSSFSNEIIIKSINFLQKMTYSRQNTQNDELNKNYGICYHLLCNLSSNDTFFRYILKTCESFTNFFCAEDASQIFDKAISIVNNKTVNLQFRVYIMLILTRNLNFFTPETVLNLYKISFELCTQILTEDGTFPVDYLDFFENILSYSSTDENDDDCLNYEFVNNLYNFTKKMISSFQPNLLIYTTFVAVLTVFLLKCPEIIQNDCEFFNQFLLNCLDRNCSVCLEMVCYLLENSVKINSKFYENIFSNSISSYIQKLVKLISSPNVPRDLRLKSIDAITFVCEKNNKFSYNLPGLFETIQQSKKYFSNENFDLFILCESITLYLDPEITNEQLISLYQYASEIISTKNESYFDLIPRCFFLMESIILFNFNLKRKIDFDLSFTLPIINFFLTSDKLQEHIVTSCLQFLRNAIQIYKSNAIEFEKNCIELLLPCLSKFQSSELRINLLKTLSYAIKYSSNYEVADFFIKVIFGLMGNDREAHILELFKISSKIVELLNFDNLKTLFNFSMEVLNNKESDENIISQVMIIIKKIVRYCFKNIENLNDFSIIERTQNLIDEFIQKKLAFQDGKNSIDCYSDFISYFSQLISIIWNFQSEKNPNYFIFLLNYLAETVDMYNIEKIVGSLGDGLNLNIINGNDQEVIVKLVNIIPNLALVSSSDFSVQQNICFLIGQLQKIDVNLVLPFVDQFLSIWFLKCFELIDNKIELDQCSNLIQNISFLFFQIFGKTKPNFPSANANQLIVMAIRFFPPSQMFFSVQNTSTLLDSILTNFFNESDLKNISLIKNNADENGAINFFNIYSELALSFVKLLSIDRDQLLDERDLDEDVIAKTRNILLFIVNQNKFIKKIILELVPTQVLQQIFPSR